MGFVWNVMLSFDDEEWWDDAADEARATCEPLERINAWLPHGRLVSLTGPTYADGAGSGMDANLYAGGFKHFDIDGFIEVVKAQRWKARSKVQLWIKGAEEGMATEPFIQVGLGAAKTPRKKTPTKRRSAVGEVVQAKDLPAAGRKTATRRKSKPA
jgi:hypothetical protein